jgi:hypothetical protein
MYLLRSSLAAALLDDLFEHPAGLPVLLQSLSSPASARLTMKYAAFLTPSMNVQRERAARLEDKKEDGGFQPSTLFSRQLRGNYSPLQKVRS